MPKKRINLSIDEQTYKEYQKYCEDQCMVVSKKVEHFMKEELKKKENRSNK
ncbi:hypothetical protein ACFL0W_02630 [Nanoarchaeota archaeon]